MSNQGFDNCDVSKYLKPEDCDERGYCLHCGTATVHYLGCLARPDPQDPPCIEYGGCSVQGGCSGDCGYCIEAASPGKCWCPAHGGAGGPVRSVTEL